MEGRIYFEYQDDVHTSKVAITLSPDSSLSEVLESFEQFLKAAGYIFDGVIDITEKES